MAASKPPEPLPAKPPNPKRGEVWRVEFDPTRGAEIQKTRPAVVINPEHLGRLPLRVVVPLTGWQAHFAAPVPLVWLTRVQATKASGLVKESAADALQVRCVALERFVARIGTLSESEMREIAAAVALCAGYEAHQTT